MHDLKYKCKLNLMKNYNNALEMQQSAEEVAPTYNFTGKIEIFNKDKELKRIYESVFNSNKNELFRSLKNKSQDHLIYEKQKFNLNMETGEPLRKEYSTPEEYRMGTFKVYLTKNENIQIVMKLSDETISWIIELDTEDDIFNLFGKSKIFRAEVDRTLSSNFNNSFDLGILPIKNQIMELKEYEL